MTRCKRHMGTYHLPCMVCGADLLSIAIEQRDVAREVCQLRARLAWLTDSRAPHSPPVIRDRVAAEELAAMLVSSTDLTDKVHGLWLAGLLRDGVDYETQALGPGVLLEGERVAFHLAPNGTVSVERVAAGVVGVGPMRCDPRAGDLKLWSDGTETYIAESVEQAYAMQLENIGENPNGIDAWDERTTPDPMSITFDDGRGKVTATIAEMIARECPGFLCSTEW